jgi:hypothetical protein
MRTVRELLRTNVLAGKQVVKFAPWQIPVEGLNDSSVVDRIKRIRDGNRSRIRPARMTTRFGFPGYDRPKSADSFDGRRSKITAGSLCGKPMRHT